MKPIKISQENANAIEAELLEVNGKSKGHTFSQYKEIEALLPHAEKALIATGLPKNKWAGAIYTSSSGEPVPNSYRFSRTGTSVRLKRTSAGWTFAHAQTCVLYTNGGKSALLLTPEQKDEAVRRFSAGLNLITA